MVDNAAPLLAVGRPWALRAAAAAVFLTFASMALPMAIVTLARPLPLVLQAPLQAAALATSWRRNAEVCAAVAAAGGGAAATVRLAHRAVSLAATLVQEAALVLAGQQPSRLLALLTRPGLARQALLEPSGDPAIDAAACGALLAFLQLTCGFAAPLLALSASEARIYAAAAGSRAPTIDAARSAAAGGSASSRPGRGIGRRLETLQRWLAVSLAAVPSAVASSVAGRLVAVYSLAALWVALAALH